MSAFVANHVYDPSFYSDFNRFARANRPTYDGPHEPYDSAEAAGWGIIQRGCLVNMDGPRY